MKREIFLCVALMSAAAPGWAINKCTGADGKTVFQDAPCAGKGEKIEVRPASGNAPVATPAAATAPTIAPAAASATAPTSKKEGAFGPAWQRRTFLENRGIADARGAVQAHQAQCEAKQRELASKKNLARNNLAGATWEQSISSEMQAAAAICDSKSRDLRSQLDGLERELRELQAKQ